LTKAEEVDISIAIEDLELSVCNTSDLGGKHLKSNDLDVQIFHELCGTMIYCGDER